MAELIASGSELDEYWRYPLPANQWVIIGREADHWSVSWDMCVSRQHAKLCWRHGHLKVRRLPTGRNPILLDETASDSFEIDPGGHFVIGRTTFTFEDNPLNPDDDKHQVAEQRVFSSSELRGIPFRDADARIDILSRLPKLIADSPDDSELFVRLVNLFLLGVAPASATALVAADSTSVARASVEVVHWERRQPSADPFQPSARLILDALSRGHSILHFWGSADEDTTGYAYTRAGNAVWAFCTPLADKTAQHLAIYVEGRSLPSLSPTGSESLRDDVKFVEMMASILSSLMHSRRLQKQQTVLSQFFSPLVIKSLTNSDPEKVLAPRQMEVSVLFCDLRGFSRQSERHTGDLLSLLERVSKALRIMTGNILDHGGVVADFQGDAAMGFWGWPFHQPDAVLRACSAALAIRSMFETHTSTPGHPLADFKIGIGIATGQAVAGRIGTTDQGKVGVFGPVVNLASRLEGLTKILHASILLDEATAQVARREIGASVGRLRRVARVRPYGMDTPQMVTELLPPVAELKALEDDHINLYELALEKFVSGSWGEAFGQLNRVPAEDQVKDFLMVYIAQHERTCPAGWDGVIQLTSKG